MCRRRFLARLPIPLFRRGLGWVFGGRLLLLHHTDRVTGLDRRHAVRARFLTSDDGAEIMARYARRRPRTAQHLCASMELPSKGTDAAFREAGRAIPFVRLDAAPGYRVR
ncbi:hypothetical protein [Streptomyces sp. SLBN-31]|uniref:hypothetical protein n=1 Tax=Streptomyces sp. SLBN-31 TaxID=2768444 RepID=UPI0037D9E5BA